MALLLVLAMAAAAVAAPPAGWGSLPATDTWLAGREFESLTDALTFHLSFDAGTLRPDAAAGAKFEPALQPPAAGKAPAPEFAPGLKGQALVLGTGAAWYPREGNLPLEHQGAIALWVKPLDWQRPNGGNVIFVVIGGCRFYLQRQGPALAKDGSVLRQEMIQYLVKASGEQRLFTCLGDGAWENGRWYLLVANWRWPHLALSVNGGPFETGTLPAQPAADNFGGVQVGDVWAERTLLDEVMFFRRPLTQEDVAALYSLLGGTTVGHAAGGGGPPP
jgi:hypothetical protein